MPPKTEEMPEGGIIPSKDIKPKMDAIDQILAEPDAGEGDFAEGAPEAPPEGAPPEGGPEEGGASPEDVAALAEGLGIDPEAAAKLLEAAAMNPTTAELTVDQLITTLRNDFNLRMELEQATYGADEGGMDFL